MTGQVVEELRLPFNSLLRLTRQTATPDNWLARYLNSLGTIQKDIAKLAASSDPGRDARQFVAKLFKGESDSELYQGWLMANKVAEDLDARSAEAIASLLRAPIRSVWGSMV